MKVAIYIRVSTESQIDNYSIPLQQERMRAFCASKGWSDITEYIDGGYTGSNTDRPELQRLLGDLHKVDVVLVYRLDRLSRSQKDTLYLVEECFLPNDVEFISISETLDTTTPFGRAMIGILSVFAQLERETITGRMRDGRYKMTKDEGLWSGGADANPTGYTRLERGVLEINPEEAFLVKRVFDEYVKFKSVDKIQKLFKSEGLPVWRYDRYRRILRNRLYIGEVSFSGEWFPGAHKPIVEKDIFEKVQVMATNNRGSNYGKIKNMYLSGIVKCGRCGENMMSYSTQATDRAPKYHYYICKARRFPAEYDEKCMNKTWKRAALDEIIFSAIESLDVSDFQGQTNIKKVNFDKLLENNDKKLKKLLDLYVDGIINKTALDEKVSSLTKEKKDIIEQRKNYNLNVKKEVVELFSKGSINIREADNDERLRVIRTLIKQVTLTDTDVEIIWNIE